MNTWETMKKTANKEELRELNNVELKSLKQKQKFFHNTPPEERKNIMKHNVNVRKEAQKILPDEKSLNEFMYAKSWEAYEKRIKPFENVLKNVQKPMTSDTLKSQSVNSQPSQEEKNLQNINKNRKGLNTIVYYNEDAIKASQMKMNEKKDFKNPEPDPDLNKGIGSVEFPNAVTLNAVKNLKDQKE